MRKLLIPALLFCSLWTVILRGDAKYYRYRDNRQLYYTEQGKIYRYSDNQQLYYFRNDAIHRYRDNRKLYYFEDDKIYRYSDNRQILFYRGEDPKLVRIMILMLADM